MENKKNSLIIIIYKISKHLLTKAEIDVFCFVGVEEYTRTLVSCAEPPGLCGVREAPDVFLVSGRLP